MRNYKNPWAYEEWARKRGVPSNQWAWAADAYRAGFNEAFNEKSAAQLGRLGGKKKSKQKAAASRANGKKGGRPRKK